MSAYKFGQIVVVERNLVGVIVKVWQSSDSSYNYDVYVRSYNSVLNYVQDTIRAFIYDKELSDEALQYYE